MRSDPQPPTMNGGLRAHATQTIGITEQGRGNQLVAVGVSCMMASMLRCFAGSVTVIAATVPLVIGPSDGVVSATSCAIYDHGDPQSVVAGVPFFDRFDDTLYTVFDLAVTGTITNITTDERAGSDTYGSTDITIEVINAIGVDAVDPTLTVWSADPGWMSGYAFETGRTYFVPLQAPGLNGHPYESFLCDPISEITVEDAALLPSYAPPGVPTATPADAMAPSTAVQPVTTEPPPASTPDTTPTSATLAPMESPPMSTGPALEMRSTDGDGPGVPTWAIGAGFGGLGAVSLLSLRRRRRTHARAS